jgi:DNA-binding MarR family transcriptional regulator
MELEKELGVEKFEHEILKAAINIEYTASWLYNELNKFIRPYDLTIPQYNVLRAITFDTRKITMKDIAQRMVDKSSNVSRLVDKLVEKGLVERGEVPNDGRSKYIIITEKGAEKVKITKQILAKETLALFQTIPESEARKLNDILDKLRG